MVEDLMLSQADTSLIVGACDNEKQNEAQKSEPMNQT